MKVSDLSTYNDLPNLTVFNSEFEDRVSEPQRLLELEEEMKDTPTRWWDTHNASIKDWQIYRRLMKFQVRED